MLANRASAGKPAWFASKLAPTQARATGYAHANKVLTVFTDVFADPVRAEKLLEHIRYRTGPLLERRQGIFAFAHLTFQEYLAARAVYEGNRLGIQVERLVHEHDDGRWQEVIALYCGLAPAPAARGMIERLITQPNRMSLMKVLIEAYCSFGSELLQDSKLEYKVLIRIIQILESIRKYVEDNLKIKFENLITPPY